MLFGILSVSTLALAVLGWVFFSEQSDTDMSNREPRESEESLVEIIAFGDSLTAGYDLPQDEAYPAQLEKILREKSYAVTVINSGVSGETTRGSLERANFIRSQNPDVVILGIGGNDALRFLHIGDTRENMTSTINILKSGINPPRVVLLQMAAPINAGQKYKQEFDSLYGDLARTNDLILVPFITNAIFLDPKNKLSDGIHYNQQGYQKVIEKYLFPEIEVLVRDIYRTSDRNDGS